MKIISRCFRLGNGDFGHCCFIRTKFWLVPLLMNRHSAQRTGVFSNEIAQNIRKFLPFIGWLHFAVSPSYNIDHIDAIEKTLVYCHIKLPWAAVHFLAPLYQQFLSLTSFCALRCFWEYLATTSAGIADSCCSYRRQRCSSCRIADILLKSRL